MRRREFGWDYPPGVTGFEPQIAGPNDEHETEAYCPTCRSMRPGLLQSYGVRTLWFTCDVCNEGREFDDWAEEAEERRFDELREEGLI